MYVSLGGGGHFRQCHDPFITTISSSPHALGRTAQRGLGALPHRPAQALVRSRACDTAPAPGAPTTARSPLRSRRAQPAPAATACTVRAARAAATIGICVRLQAQARAAAPASTCVTANAPPRVHTKPVRHALFQTAMVPSAHRPTCIFARAHPGGTPARLGPRLGAGAAGESLFVNKHARACVNDTRWMLPW